MLDILYTGTLPPHAGGSGMLCGDLLAALSRLGHRVRAIAPIAAASVVAGDAFAAAHPAIDIHRIVVPYDENSPDVPPPDSYRRHLAQAIQVALHELIGRKRPDIVVAGRESFAWDVPDIAIAHTLPSAMLLQGTTSFGILRGTIPPPLAEALLTQFRKFDLLIAVARNLEPALADFGFDRLEVIENTVATDRFQPGPRPERLLQELCIGSDDIVIAHVSNLKRLKRPLDFIDSAQAALQCDPRLLYLVVGHGPLRGEMEAACDRSGLRERFRFVGWVGRECVADYLNLADVVVMTSAAEARALVYLEAQACGRVLLASDIPAAREVVTDGETGILFAMGDVADLTAKTLLIAGDPVLRDRIGKHARAGALARPLSAMAGAYEAAFRDVVRHRAAVEADKGGGLDDTQVVH